MEKLEESVWPNLHGLMIHFKPRTKKTIFWMKVRKDPRVHNFQLCEVSIFSSFLHT